MNKRTKNTAHTTRIGKLSAGFFVLPPGKLMTTIRIPLINGGYAVVDEEDYSAVEPHRWSAQFIDGKPATVISRRRSGGERVVMFMHRVIMNPPDDMFVDHINGDIFDNRKENLRVCTHSQNMKNRRMHKNNQAGYKGAYLDKSAADRGAERQWRAEINANGVRHCLGQFATAEDAHAAYVRAAKRLHGEFACAG